MHAHKLYFPYFYSNSFLTFCVWFDQGFKLNTFGVFQQLLSWFTKTKSSCSLSMGSFASLLKGCILHQQGCHGLIIETKLDISMHSKLMRDWYLKTMICKANVETSDTLLLHKVMRTCMMLNPKYSCMYCQYLPLLQLPQETLHFSGNFWFLELTSLQSSCWQTLRVLE